MKTILRLSFIVTLILLSAAIHAQGLIAVQNGGTPRFYESLEDAITNAQNKDTLYIPGRIYSFTDSKITIDKELPFTIPGKETVNVSIRFTPNENTGAHLGDLYFVNKTTDPYPQQIATSIHLI